MSKTTKALAILGVVAGLGVATLPLGAYATTSTTAGYGIGKDDTTGTEGDSVVYDARNNAEALSADITVKTTIDSYISMEVEGNADETTGSGTSVTPKHIVLLGDTDGKITNNSTSIQTGDAKFNIKSNATKGYSLTIKDKDTDNNLVANTKNDANSNATNSENATDKWNVIPAGTPTADSGSGAVSAWGYKSSSAKSGVNDTVADYAVVPKQDAVDAGKIASRATATDDEGDDITVTFGVTASASQAAGEYKDVVVVTATPTLN